MAYCDFNPRLFKPFTSKKTKIEPNMSDDWEIIPSQYVTIGGFSLRSKKLNQEVADINLLRFLQFCKEQNLVIEGLCLKGNYVIGNDRSVYTEEMFNKWKDTFEKRTETIIDKKDYKVGHKYKTPCGAELIYLGYKYVSRLKDSFDFNYKTKITKKHFVTSTEKWECSWSVEELKQKFTKDLGKVLTNDQVKEYLTKHYNSNVDITCWEDTKPKLEEYNIIEIDYNLERALIIKRDTKYMINDYGNRLERYKGGFASETTLNLDTLRGIRKRTGNRVEYLKADSLHRIDVVK